MGNSDTKLNFRKAVVQLTTKTQPVEAGDEAFWSQFWSESVTCVQDVFTLIPAAEIRALREESPSNLATLCYKAVEKLVQAAEAGCRSQREQQTVLNCVRLLTRILPYIFEDPDWRGFFWSTLPGQSDNDAGENESSPLAQSLLNALADLLFCPEFTVSPNRKSGPDNPEDMQTIDSCEYIWEAGVGFAHSPPGGAQYYNNRQEMLKLLLTCFSETMYLPPVADAHAQPNQWIAYFTSTENRHALPLFTSLLNEVCAYDPIGYGVPYNHLMFADSREPLVEAALQVLCVTLDNDPTGSLSGQPQEQASGSTSGEQADMGGPDNLFVNYLSRIHREEDFAFILKGITRLLNNPLTQTYLPGSCKKVQFHQELLVMFWKMCDINKKFMFYVLKSSDVLDILVPILYFLNDARADQSRVGLMHIGVFILLLLSGERNFGVRLNKPYTVRVPMDIAVFTGTHADFLIIVFHKIITTGHQKLQPLFDCLLTIIVNVSPYLKTLSMVASTKMLHLLEAFSTPWFLYASPTNHHLVFFLLEVFNNIIQYQFDGNANVVYTIIRKRNVFHQLANLPTDHSAIAKALTKRGKKFVHQPVDTSEQPMEGSIPATEAEPGTLKVSLAATPVPPCQTACYQLAQMTSDLLPDDVAFIYDTDNLEQVCDPVTTIDPELINLYDDDDETNSDMDPWESVLKRSKSVTDLRELSESFNGRKRHKSEASGDNFYGKLKRSKSLPNCKDLVDKQVKHMPYTTSFDFWYENFWKTWRKPETSKRKKKKVTIVEEANQVIEIKEESEVKQKLAEMLGVRNPVSTFTEVHELHHPSDKIHKSGIEKMTETSRASSSHTDQQTLHKDAVGGAEMLEEQGGRSADSGPEGQSEGEASQLGDPEEAAAEVTLSSRNPSTSSPPASPTSTTSEIPFARNPLARAGSSASGGGWVPTPEWVASWKQKLPLQTIMRLLQVLVPQVEKICIDKGLTDESEILKFLQHGTLVGLLPVPHPILIRKYQANSGTTMWFRTYMWGVIYLRNVDPPVWYDTDVKLFEIQRV